TSVAFLRVLRGRVFDVPSERSLQRQRPLAEFAEKFKLSHYPKCTQTFLHEPAHLLCLRLSRPEPPDAGFSMGAIQILRDSDGSESVPMNQDHNDGGSPNEIRISV